MKRQAVHQGIFDWSMYALAFFIPVFPRIIPALIILLGINWLFSSGIRSKISALREGIRKASVIPALLYLLYVAGLLYTTNFHYAGFDLEVKLSLILFPLIFCTSALSYFPEKLISRVLYFFLSGCVTVAVILIGHAMYANFALHVPGSFVYIKLAWYFHPGYLAMYFVFGLAVVADLLYRNGHARGLRRNVGLLLLLLFFMGFIFMLSSKAGILMMVAVLVFYIILWAVIQKKFIAAGGIFIIIFLFLMMMGKLFPEGFTRLSVAGHVVAEKPGVADPEESTASRFNTWKNAVDVIADNFLFGVGTGDVKDALMKNYQANGNEYAYRIKMNAHSQFFQTFIALGLPGIITLIGMLLIPGWFSWKQKQFLLFSFLAIIAFNMLTESILETQAGVVFFAFFYVLLFRKPALK
ncbi:MAG: O-antigen ligase family protein [Syntrophothermus sp.]